MKGTPNLRNGAAFSNFSGGRDPRNSQQNNIKLLPRIFNIFSYLLYISLSNFKCGPSTNISSHNLGADNACRFFKTDCKSYEKCLPRRLSGHIWPGVYRCVCSKKGWHVVRGRGCMGKLEYLHCLFLSKQLLYISLN